MEHAAVDCVRPTESAALGADTPAKHEESIMTSILLKGSTAAIRGDPATIGVECGNGAGPPGQWPPGPSGLRALRYLGLRRELLSFTERCNREYGGICGIRLLGARLCLISDPLLIDEVLVKHASRLKKWDTGRFDFVLGKGLLTSQGELWRRQRSLIQPVFAPTRMPDYDASILSHARAMLAAWPRDGRIDVHQEMLRVSLKITASALFGADASGVEDLIARVQHFLLAHFEDSMNGIPLPMKLPTPSNVRARKLMRQFDAALMTLIGQRRKGDPTRDLLGVLLDARSDASAAISDQQLRDECMTMLIAGHETTAVALTWALWLVAKHPAIGREVSAQIDRAIGEHDDIDAASVDKLPLVRNVLNEALRLYPPGWVIGRINTEAIAVDRYLLPAGTQLFVLPYFAQRDAAYFHRPQEFLPHRWEEPQIRQIPRCAFMPFGAGPRKCVGMSFALREMILTLACILRAFSVSVVAGDPEARACASITLRPARGLRISVRERRSDRLG